MDDLRNILKNFFKNRYTRHEYFSVYHGFEAGHQNKRFLETLEKQWNEVNEVNAEGFHPNLIWHNITRQINLQSPTGKGRIKFLDTVQKTAAILFLPLLIASLLYFYSVNYRTDETAWAEISCPAGVRTEFRLPDGSTGFLNGRSRLKYPVNFRPDRKVYLSGEAFFEVVKNKKSSFRVITPTLEAEVLGTSFNIMAYKDQSYEEITLKTGRLKVLNKKNEELSSLKPDQQFIFDTRHNRFSVKKVNTINFTSWTEGKLIIQDERFEDVVKKLSRWYDVEMEIEDRELKEFRYYAKFENEPLSEVLKLIALTAPIRYQEDPRIKQHDGSFSKRKIKFRLNEHRIKNFN